MRLPLPRGERAAQRPGEEQEGTWKHWRPSKRRCRPGGWPTPGNRGEREVPSPTWSLRERNGGATARSVPVRVPYPRPPKTPCPALVLSRSLPIATRPFPEATPHGGCPPDPAPPGQGRPLSGGSTGGGERGPGWGASATWSGRARGGGQWTGRGCKRVTGVALFEVSGDC